MAKKYSQKTLKNIPDMEQSEFDLLIDKNGKRDLGYQTDRLKFDHNDLENAFASRWRKENKKSPGINFGKGLLQDLFFHERKFPRLPWKFLTVTNRERLIVATAIQWLGTNCGFAFLCGVLRSAGYDVVQRKDFKKEKKWQKAIKQNNEIQFPQNLPKIGKK